MSAGGGAYESTGGNHVNRETKGREIDYSQKQKPATDDGEPVLMLLKMLECRDKEVAELKQSVQGLMIQNTDLRETVEYLQQKLAKALAASIDDHSGRATPLKRGEIIPDSKTVMIEATPLKRGEVIPDSKTVMTEAIPHVQV